MERIAARSARATLRAAADRGAAILMSTHLLGVAERMCDRILLMDKAKLVADKKGAALTELLRQGPSAIEDFYVGLIAGEGPTYLASRAGQRWAAPVQCRDPSDTLAP